MNLKPTQEWLEIYHAKRQLLEPVCDLNAYFTAGEIAGMKIEPYGIGNVSISTGELIVRDPLVYLNVKEDNDPYLQRVPIGTFPLTLCVVLSDDDCARYAAAKLDFTNEIPVRYEEALLGHEDLSNFQTGEYFGFNVDAGLATIVDQKTADCYCDFYEKWEKENLGKNIYDDYFAEIFRNNYKENPKHQREGGDWINWTIPETNCQMPIFQSGFGDGAYPVYYGYNDKGDVCRVVIQFIDIELAYSEEDDEE